MLNVIDIYWISHLENIEILKRTINASIQTLNDQQEFGQESDFNQIRQQNNKAEQNKQQASGKFAQRNKNNNNN